MQQWHYCSLRWSQDGSLALLTYHSNIIGYETITPDPLIDDNNSWITLRRWTAALGEKGWELSGILRDEESQEWVFKQPIT